MPVVTLLVRTSGDPAALAPMLRSAVREADPMLVAEAVMPLEGRMLTAVARPRLYALLLGGFAAFALLVAGVGLCGVLSYNVAQRSRELAIRAAVGASPGDLLRLVVKDALAASLSGLAAGLVVSFALAHVISGLLYGVTAHDRLTYVLVPLLVLLVSIAACAAPARRAATLDPLTVLRGA